MKINKTVYTCDMCDKEFKIGFSFYGVVVEILNGEEEKTIVGSRDNQTHICSVCIPKTFNFVQTGIR